MKWGELYGSFYVNTLFAAVKDNLEQNFDFVCLTDNPAGVDEEILCRPIVFDHLPRHQWGGMWPKLQIFDERQFGSYDLVLFLDLDIVILRDLDAFVEIARRGNGLYLIPKFRGLLWRIIPAWFWNGVPWAMNKVSRGNSSIVAFNPKQQSHLFDNFEPARHVAKFKNDQNYVSELATKRRLFPLGWSLERNWLVRPWPFSRIFPTHRDRPNRAKVVIFNGWPNPYDLASDDIGEWGRRNRKTSGGLPWVADYLRKYTKVQRPS